MSTKAELRLAIKREARIKSSTDLDTLVDDIVADLMRDFCNKTRFHELLQVDVPITLVDAVGVYSLPADYQNLGALRYGRGAQPPTVWRTLVEKTDVVRKTTDQGLPYFYQLIAGFKINMWPTSNILATDFFVIDYYVDPASLYTLETSPFPVPRLESAVKKAAIARVQRFSSATSESQLTDRDSDASFTAGQAGS